MSARTPTYQIRHVGHGPSGTPAYAVQQVRKDGTFVETRYSGGRGKPRRLNDPYLRAPNGSCLMTYDEAQRLLEDQR